MTEKQEERIFTILRWMMFCLAFIVFTVGSITCVIAMAYFLSKIFACILAIQLIVIGFAIFNDWRMWL